MDSLPAEPQGNPKNSGLGSLPFLQQIFLTQEMDQGLLHYWWILYQLSIIEALENLVISTKGGKKNYLSSEFSKIITRKINSVMY